MRALIRRYLIVFISAYAVLSALLKAGKLICHSGFLVKIGHKPMNSFQFQSACHAIGISG